MVVVSPKKILLVWVAWLLALYLLLELGFFYYFSWLFPFSALGEAGPGAALLAQYSKQGVYPKNYLAIVGDSYAYGQGDWSIEGMYRIRPAYSAAHLLHQRLGRDVVSFGFPAADSIKANRTLPDFFLAYAQAVRYRKIEDPDTILVYFYEGNDLNDNVEVAEKRIIPRLPPSQSLRDESFFQQQIIPQLIQEDETFQKLRQVSFTDKLLLFQLARALTTDFISRAWHGTFRAPWKPWSLGHTGQAQVGHHTTFLIDRIQTPALSLSQQEVDLGLYVFEQSLLALRQRFPASKIGVAYIPAVVTPYRVVSPQVSDYYKDRKNNNSRMQEAARIRPRSDYICQQVRGIAERHGVGFVDSRSRLRAVAAQQAIHGPYDWNHFNRRGYETLGEELLLLVEQLGIAPLPPLPPCMWEKN